jgi:hypothetical protein
MLSIYLLLAYIDRPEFRSQKFYRLKKILQKVGIPEILLIWKQNQIPQKGDPSNDII